MPMYSLISHHLISQNRMTHSWQCDPIAMHHIRVVVKQYESPLLGILEMLQLRLMQAIILIGPWLFLLLLILVLWFLAVCFFLCGFFCSQLSSEWLVCRGEIKKKHFKNGGKEKGNQDSRNFRAQKLPKTRLEKEICPALKTRTSGSICFQLWKKNYSFCGQNGNDWVIHSHC